MIECSSENIWYKKRRPKVGRRFFAWLFVIILIVLSIAYYKFVVVDSILRICADYAHSYCTESVNSAVLDSLSESTKYSDLVNIEKDSNGDIALMTANVHKINVISREITNSTSIKLKDKMDNGVPIPLLAFTGISILSGYGKEINLKTIYVSDVSCGFISDFKSVGVNQTLHSIYVEVVVNVNINLPLCNKKETFQTKILISESVLVGKVPETYLNGNLFAR